MSNYKRTLNITLDDAVKLVNQQNEITRDYLAAQYAIEQLIVLGGGPDPDALLLICPERIKDFLQVIKSAGSDHNPIIAAQLAQKSRNALLLQAARARLGFTQSKMAAELGITERQYSNLERSKSKMKKTIEIAVKYLLIHRG